MTAGKTCRAALLLALSLASCACSDLEFMNTHARTSTVDVGGSHKHRTVVVDGLLGVGMFCLD
jgi:hypothetical protein